MEHGFVFVGADDGAAGSGKFGAGTGVAGGFDHFAVAFADIVEGGAAIEVGIEQGAQFVAFVCKQAIACLVGEVGPEGDGIEYFGIVADKALA